MSGFSFRLEIARPLGCFPHQRYLHWSQNVARLNNSSIAPDLPDERNRVRKAGNRKRTIELLLQYRKRGRTTNLHNQGQHPPASETAMANSNTPDLTKFTNYEYKFKLSGDTAAAAIVRFVKEGSKVLDIGAGSGSITRQLVDVKKCEVVALENNPVAVTKLKTFCADVVTFDLNDARWAAQLSGHLELLKRPQKFDYVIAGDVLEHLYDPWSVLKGMASLLNENGRVIMSVPHSGHSTVVAAFYSSNITLRESGILDKTHIRFFGLKNIEDLFEGAGLAITQVHYVIRTPEVTEFADDWRALPEMLRQILSARDCADVYQVVTEAALTAHVPQPVKLFGRGANPIPKPSGLWEKLFPRR